MQFDHTVLSALHLSERVSGTQVLQVDVLEEPLLICASERRVTVIEPMYRDGISSL